jgi:hypothetical protein
MKRYLDKLPKGWFPTDPKRAETFQAELQRELPNGHLLKGRTVLILAHREGTDDILCQHIDEPDRFIVVHLSWIGKTEINAQHPFVEVDGSFDDFLAYESSFLNQ